MLFKRMQELASQKAKLVELENAVLAERESQLLRLHSDLGYETRAELIKALQSLKTKGPKRGRKKVRGKAKAKAAAPAKKKRTRAKITPEIRDGIIEAVKAGGTGAAVAKKFGVSLPTVQNIKRAAGLTRKG